MKRKDITLIVVVIIISSVFSLVIANFLFGSPKNRQERVEVVEPITANFEKPDVRYFNTNSVDPTQLIKIKGNPNPNPFTTGH